MNEGAIQNPQEFFNSINNKHYNNASCSSSFLIQQSTPEKGSYHNNSNSNSNSNNNRNEDSQAGDQESKNYGIVQREWIEREDIARVE